MDKPLIYIAGPLGLNNKTEHDPMTNIRLAVEAADKIMDWGGHPYVPHFTAFWHMMFYREKEDWMELDLNILTKCDALYRLRGTSPGADREVAEAKTIDIPIFYQPLLSEFLDDNPLYVWLTKGDLDG